MSTYIFLDDNNKLVKSSNLTINNINEYTPDAGVNIEGIILKDTNITGNVTGNATTATKIASITNSNIVQLETTQTLTNKTLTSPIITGLGTISGTFTGDLAGNLVGNVTGNATTATKIASIINSNIVQLTDTQTLSNKTLNNSNGRNIMVYDASISRLFIGNETDNIHMFYPYFVLPKIEDTSRNNYYNFTVSELTANRNVNLPLLTGNDEFTFNNHTQTLSNKTLISPTITGSGNIAGNFTGDLTGDITGDVTGDVTGNVTGDVTGNVTGNNIIANNNIRINGTFTAGGGTGTLGQVLKSTESGIEWADESGGSSDSLIITSNGNVGIGTSEPSQKLHVNGSIQLDTKLIFASNRYIECGPSNYGISFYGTNVDSGKSYNLWLFNSAHTICKGILGVDNNGPFMHINGVGDALNCIVEDNKAIVSIPNAMRINGFISTAGNNAGSAGDGTLLTGSNAFKPFDNSYWQVIAGNPTAWPYWDLQGTDYDPANINSTGISLVCERGLFLKDGCLYIACDKRNKHNIAPIDDKFALNIINKCNMYKFKHNDQLINTNNWYYNVMAQEVKEVFPEGVNILRDYLADIMVGIKCSFEKISEKKYKMKILNPKEEWKLNKGEKFKFLMNNDYTNGWNVVGDNNDIKFLKCEEDNTFYTDKEYKYILLYGRKVNDYLVVDKEKMYSLYHSAIQELSKNNIEQQTEIDTLKTEVNMLKDELSQIKNMILSNNTN